VIRGPIRGSRAGSRNHCRASWRSARNCLGNSVTGRALGRNRPRRGRDPAPGRVRPMPSPGGNTIRPDKRPASSSFVLGRRRRPAETARGALGGLRALQLDAGSGRMVPRTRVGRSALRAAAPAGRGSSRNGSRASWARGYSERITWAGLPTAITLAGRSLTTTAPAPTTVFSPMLTPGQTITPPPSQTLSSDASCR
jgi:hypothetical protein